MNYFILLSIRIYLSSDTIFQDDFDEFDVKKVTNLTDYMTFVIRKKFAVLR